MSRRRLAVYGYGRRRQNVLSNLLTMVMLGLILGAAFSLFDRNRPGSRPPQVAVAPTATATLRPTATSTPTLEPTTTLAAYLPVFNQVETSLFVPTAGINTSVIEVYLDGVSWDVSQLGEHAGHLQGTARLDAEGNKVLAGHVELADGSPGIFADIGKLNVGDPIILKPASGERTYTVDAILKVSPDDLKVLYPTQTDQITLVTCDNYSFLQDTYKDRLVVVAKRSA
jgi:LPXTG-site transpeptidase (sortase) family protein